MMDSTSPSSNSMEGGNNIDLEDTTHQGALNVKDIANRFNSNRRKTSFKPAWAKSLPKTSKVDSNQKKIEKKSNYSSTISSTNNANATVVDSNADQEMEIDMQSGSQEKQSLDKEIKLNEEGAKGVSNGIFKTGKGHHKAKFWSDPHKELPITNKEKEYMSPVISSNTDKNSNFNDDSQQLGKHSIVNELKPSISQRNPLSEGGRDSVLVSENLNDEAPNKTRPSSKDLIEENHKSDIKSRIAKFSRLGSTVLSLDKSTLPLKKDESNKDDQDGCEDRLNHMKKKSEPISVRIDANSLKDLPSCDTQVEQKSDGHFWRNQMKRNSGSFVHDSLKKEVPNRSIAKPNADHVNIIEESPIFRENNALNEEPASMTDVNVRDAVVGDVPQASDSVAPNNESTAKPKVNAAQVEFITTSESVGTNIMIWKQREQQNEKVMKPIEPGRWKQQHVSSSQPNHVSRKPKETEQKQLQRIKDSEHNQYSSQTDHVVVLKQPQHLQGIRFNKPPIAAENEAKDPPQNQHQTKLQNEVQIRAKEELNTTVISVPASELKSSESMDFDDQERYKNFKGRNTYDLSFESQEVSFDVEELKTQIGFKQNKRIDTDLDRQGILSNSDRRNGTKNVENQHSPGARMKLKHRTEETPLRSNRSIDVSNSREEIDVDHRIEPNFTSPTLPVSQLKKQLWGTGEKLKTWQSRATTQETVIHPSKSKDDDIIINDGDDTIKESAEQIDEYAHTSNPSTRDIHRSYEADVTNTATAAAFKSPTIDQTVNTDSLSLPVSQLKKQLWGTGEKLKTWQSRATTQETVIHPSKSKDDDIIINDGDDTIKESAEQIDEYAHTSNPSTRHTHRTDINYSRAVSQEAIIQTCKSEEGAVFEDRFYRAAQLAQQIDDHSNVLKLQNHLVHATSQQVDEHALAHIHQKSNGPEPVGSSRPLSSHLRKSAENASNSVEILLEKLAAALNGKDDPDAALKEIDSILRKERQGLGEDKHHQPVQATIMEDETLEDSNVDEFAHVHDGFSDDDEEEEYSDDDSTVSSITNPTYHESFQRHSPRSRAYDLVYQTGPQKGLPLPAAKPAVLTHPKVLEQRMSPELFHGGLHGRVQGLEEAVHGRFGMVQDASIEVERYGLQSGTSPVKAFSEKGRSMNNKGLLNQIQGWDEDDDDVSQAGTPQQEMDVKHPSPPFSPSERLKRLANAANKYEQRQNLRHRRRTSTNPYRSRVFYPTVDATVEAKTQPEAFDINSDDWESIPGLDFFQTVRQSKA